MTRFLLTFCAVLFLISDSTAQNDTIGSGLSDSTLIEFLRTNYTPSNPKDYDEARDSMYQHLDVDLTDSLTCVYSGLRAKADGTRTPSNGSQSFNTEHSWPQSFYDNAEPMRGDIHHLYPVWSSVNSSRGNHPFAEINDNSTTSWWYWENGGSVNSVPVTNIDLYSEYFNDTFEPREDHKGNAARAMFYFWTLYQNNTDIVNDDFDNVAYFNGMKETLYQWHQDDPVDADELQRSLGIESIQGNRNPFIHDTTLVRRAYFNVESEPAFLPDVFISEVYEANGGTVKYVELFNNTESDINFITEDWALLRYSNANESGSETTISLTGTIKAKDFYVIGDDNSSSGVQTIFGDGMVDQNESGINHNGNDKYTLVKNASDTAVLIDGFSGDNIGNSSSFSSNQVVYRVYSELPNNGDFGQTSQSSNGSTVASGNWKVFDISSNNANAKMIATPGYSKGIESSELTEAVISGNQGWRLLSIPSTTPTLNQISDDLAIQGINDSNTPNLFTYNSSGVYATPSSLGESLNVGEGLVIYFFDNTANGSTELPIIVDLATDQEDPTSDVMVNLNSTTEVSDSYFTLVGNPFQNNFDVNSIISDGTIQANIHLLDNGLYYSETRGSSVLLPWQGFWIESPDTDIASTVTFPISGKTNSDATLSAYSKELSETSEIQFNLRSEKSYDKGCRITFNENATIGWDEFDSSKLNPTISDYAILSCVKDQKHRSVFSLPINNSNIEIPLHIESFNVDDQLLLDWDVDPKIFDRYTVQVTDIETDEVFAISEKGEYSFLYTSKENKRDNPAGTSSLGRSIKFKSTDSSRFIVHLYASSAVNNEEEVREAIPEFELFQNYPNPFNPTTQIKYLLTESAEVSLRVYSSAGQEIAVLVDGNQIKGSKTVEWNASHLASGVYYAKLSANGFLKTIKMTLLK